jgi:hypothetical protein
VSSIFEALRDAVEQETSPAAFEQWFANVGRALGAGDITTTQAEILTLTGYRAVRSSADSSEADRRALVMDFLLPRALRAAEYNGFLRPVEGDVVRRQLREVVDAAGPESRDALVLDISERVVNGLSLGDPTAACLVALTIAVRTTELVDRLLEVSTSRHDEIGDLALFTVAVLQPSGSTRENVFHALLRRAVQQFSLPIGRGLAILADQRSLGTALEWRSRAESEDVGLRGVIAAALIGRIAASNSGDSALQDEIWRSLLSTSALDRDSPSLSVLRLSDFIESINSPDVVRDLSRHLVDGVHHSKGQNQLARLAENATRCLLPRQLAGWDAADLPALGAAIRPFACRDTEHKGHTKTAEFRDKEIFWNLALHVGVADLLTWFGDGIAKETNPHLRLSLCRELACFKLDAMPPEASAWVTRRYVFQPNDTTYGWTNAFGGVAIARSTATKDAFESLLLTGFSIRESASADVVDALTDVSLGLAQSDSRYVVDRLMEIAREGETWQRDAAAAALAEVAAARRVDESEARRVRDLAFGESRISSFARGILIASLGSMPADLLADEHWERIRQIARQGDNDEAPRALIVLAQHDRLANDVELLETVLGLSRSNDGWHFTGHSNGDLNRTVYSVGPGGWGPHVVGYLFRRYRREFAPAIAEALRSSDINVRVQSIAALYPVSGSAPDLELPDGVRRALLDYAIAGQTSFSTTLDAFDHLGELAPDLLLSTRWAEHARSWLPAARARLARSLGVTAARRSNSQPVSIALDSLATLATDQNVTVRREALRSLANASPSTLEGLANAWAGHPQSAWRQRASEMLEYLPSNVVSASPTLSSLIRDPDPLVRERSEASVEAKRRADSTRVYVEIVRTSLSEQNGDLLRLRRYLNAIVALGDEHAALALRGMQRDIRDWRVRTWLKMSLDKLEARITSARKDEGTGVSALDRDVVVKRANGFVLAGATTAPATITLWASPRARPGEGSYWGGTALSSVALISPVSEDKLKVQLDAGEPLNVLVTNSRQRLLRDDQSEETYLIFTGNGDIPEFLQR